MQSSTHRAVHIERRGLSIRCSGQAGGGSPAALSLNSQQSSTCRAVHTEQASPSCASDPRPVTLATWSCAPLPPADHPLSKTTDPAVQPVTCEPNARRLQYCPAAGPDCAPAQPPSAPHAARGPDKLAAPNARPPRRTPQRDLTKRLGNIAGGVQNIKDHPWFEPIDWAALAAKQLRAPYVPVILGDQDTANFDEFGNTPALDTSTPLTAQEQALFEAF
jgi:hypothetical protein